MKPKLDLGEGRGFEWWLFEYLKYPEIALVTEAEGRVMFSFIVSRDGDVEDVKILSGEKGLENVFGKEIERVMAMCPKWVPGELKGIKVGVRFIWEVDFSYCKDWKESRITGQPVDPVTCHIIWHDDSWGDADTDTTYTGPIPYMIVAHKPTFKGDSVVLRLCEDLCKYLLNFL